MTTSMRKPNVRYLTDGAYVYHDGYDIVVCTFNGVEVSNEVVLDASALDALQEYRTYVAEFIAGEQHRFPNTCETCNKSLEDPDHPLPGNVNGQVYPFRYEDKYIEVRLCHGCASDDTVTVKIP